MTETRREYYAYPGEGFPPGEPYRAEILELRHEGDGLCSLILDRTIFYPEGGGQPADRGTIRGVPLLDVREKEGEILHLVAASAAAGLGPGQAELVLDQKRRREFTALHTGQHLLSGIILRMTGKPTVSMHLGDEICTIDVDVPELDGETITAIEEAAADAIEENRRVSIHLCPPEDVNSFPLRKVPPKGEEVIRVVEIEGNDFSPCCGTHLKASGEIGMLRILGAEKYKGMTRVSFIAGRRVLRDSRLLRRNADIVSRALKVPVTETARGVLEFLEKAGQAEKNLKALEEGAARIKAGVLLEKAAGLCGGTGAPPVIELYGEEAMDEVLRIGRAAQKSSSTCFILASAKDLKFAALCSAKGFDLRPLVQAAFEASGGKGGGGPSFFQGSFETTEALEKFIQKVQNTPAEI
jgi:alanyl-tRNA synthetase